MLETPCIDPLLNKDYKGCKTTRCDGYGNVSSDNSGALSLKGFQSKRKFVWTVSYNYQRTRKHFHYTIYLTRGSLKLKIRRKHI